MSLHTTLEADSAAAGIEERLDPRYVPFRRVSMWINAAILGALALAGVLAAQAARPTAWMNAASWIAWVAFAAFLAWRAHAWPAIAYRHASYRLDEHGIEIRRGVFFRLVANVPRSRIQHTDVTQGPLARKYGLATLVVHTAGTRYAAVSLPGLSHERALALRDHLLPRGGSDAV